MACNTHTQDSSSNVHFYVPTTAKFNTQEQSCARRETKERIRPKKEPVTPTYICPMQCTCNMMVVQCNTIILILVFVVFRIHLRGALHIETDRYINDVYIHINPNKRHRDAVYRWLLHMEWLYVESTKTRHTGVVAHMHVSCTCSLTLFSMPLPTLLNTRRNDTKIIEAD